MRPLRCGEIDLAIDGARPAGEHSRDFQTLRVSDYWCTPLERHPLAHSLDLTVAAAWCELGRAHERVDPLAVLPVYRELVEAELVEAHAEQYGFAARRLARMRRIAAVTDETEAVARFIAELRERYARRLGRPPRHAHPSP